jgi:hypothetical protein
MVGNVEDENSEQDAKDLECKGEILVEFTCLFFHISK